MDRFRKVNYTVYLHFDSVMGFGVGLKFKLHKRDISGMTDEVT